MLKTSDFKIDPWLLLEEKTKCPMVISTMQVLKLQSAKKSAHSLIVKKLFQFAVLHKNEGE